MPDRLPLQWTVAPNTDRALTSTVRGSVPAKWLIVNMPSPPFAWGTDVAAFPPSQADAALRAVACVNACDGIADPAAVLAEVRAAYAEAAACHTLTNRLCAALALLTPTEPR